MVEEDELDEIEELDESKRWHEEFNKRYYEKYTEFISNRGGTSIWDKGTYGMIFSLFALSLAISLLIISIFGLSNPRGFVWLTPLLVTCVIIDEYLTIKTWSNHTMVDWDKEYQMKLRELVLEDLATNNYRDGFENQFVNNKEIQERVNGIPEGEYNLELYKETFTVPETATVFIEEGLKGIRVDNFKYDTYTFIEGRKEGYKELINALHILTLTEREDSEEVK